MPRITKIFSGKLQSREAWLHSNSSYLPTMFSLLIAVWCMGVFHNGLAQFDATVDPKALPWHCNGTTETIRAGWVCDSDIDCPNGIDEHISTCGKDACLDYEFDCGGGYCIIARWTCDDDEDCINGEDEQGCSSSEEHGEGCSAGEWTCVDETCIDASWLCDGDLDCDDGSDETEETCASEISCGEDHVSCYSPAMCMPTFWICDGNEDCNDGSDEANCTKATDAPDPEMTGNCTGDFLLCSVGGNMTCVNIEKQCDGEDDCDDASDEGEKCDESCTTANTTNPDANYICHQICHKTPSGHECSCHEGFKLADDKKNCDDINECDDGQDANGKNITCDQTCINTDGGYRCGCVSGYAMRDDNHSCKAEGHDRPILHVALYESIRKKTLTVFRPGENVTGHYTEVAGLKTSPGAKIIGIDYLWKESILVWVEDSNSSSVIKFKTAERGEFLLLNISKTIGTINSLSIDWGGMNVFFTYNSRSSDGDSENTKPGKVGLVSLGGTSDGLLHGIAENFGHLSDVAAISHKGMIIISEYEDYGRIVGISMDGYQSWVYHSGISWPVSLAYDIPTDMVFWAQHSPDPSESDGIYTMKLDGSNERVVLTRAMPHMRRPSSISVFEARVFWFDIERKQVLSADAKDGRNHMVIQAIHEEGSVNASLPSTVTHPAMQPDVAGNKCDNSSCSYACVITTSDTTLPSATTPLTPECICPAGRQYFRFTATCKEQTSVPFLVTKESGMIRRLYKDKRKVVNQLMENHSATSIAYDYSRERLYFSGSRSGIFYVDMSEETLRSMPLTSGTSPTRHLTLDQISGNLYWIDGCSIKTISPRSVQNTDPVSGGTITNFPELTVFKGPDKCPQGLAYDNNRNRLYFIDLAQYGPALYWIAPDGKNLTRLQSVSPSTSIIHMTYDAYEDRVICITAGRYYSVLLFSMKLEKNEFTVYQPPSPNITAVAVSPDLIYTYSAINDTIWSQRKVKTGGDMVKEVTGNATLVSSHATDKEYPGGGLVYVDPDLFISGTKNPCALNGSAQCSQFCFPSASSQNGYICACEDGLRLAGDGVNCLANQCPLGQFYCNWNNVSADQIKHRYLSKDSFPSCISQEEVCDRRTVDCYDGSDESTAACECDLPLYRPCIPKDGDPDADYQCVKSNFFCDGDIDCLNQADEEDCPCDLEIDYLCSEPPGTLSLCIPLEWLNDGEEDCLGGGDEMAEANYTCFDHEIKCRTGSECIDEDFQCDDIEDCSDGSDESDCPAGNATTSSSTTAQETTQAVTTAGLVTTAAITTQSTTVATTKACGVHDYRCDSGECVLRKWVCDGMPDCGDASDEGGNCSVSCKTHPDTIERCVDVCHSTPKGPVCPCPDGYGFDSAKSTCSDIDECTTGKNNCDQICENTSGSFKCSCLEGYKLLENHMCKAEGTVPFFVVPSYKDLRLFTARSQEHYEIVKLDSSTDISNIQPRVLAARDTSHVYWIDQKSKSLFLTNVWTAHTTLLTKYVSDVNQMMWDWVGEKLYWMHDKSIEMVTKDGQYSRPVVDSLDKLTGMVMQPLKDLILYSSVRDRTNGKITQCQGNGQPCSTYAESMQDFYRTLTIDIVGDALYWVLHYANRIESSSLNEYDSLTKRGFDIEVGKAVTGLVVFEQHVSWIETDIKDGEVDETGFVAMDSAEEQNRKISNVYSVHKRTFDAKTKTTIRANLELSYSLTILQKMSQPKPDANYCTLPLFCEFLCFNKIMDHCLCPTKKLHSVERPAAQQKDDCPSLPVCPDPFLLDGVKATIQSVDSQEGGLAKVQCENDATTHTLTCQSDGTWKPEPPTCSQVIGCERPDSAFFTVSAIANGNHVYGSTLNKFEHGSQVSIDCIDGYGILDNAKFLTQVKLTCEDDGKWDKPTPICVAMSKTTSSPIKHPSQTKVLPTTGSSLNPVSTNGTRPAPAAKNTASNGIVTAIIVIVVLILLLIIGLIVCWKYRSFSASLFHRDAHPSHKLMTPAEGDVIGVDNPGFAVSYQPRGENGDGGVAVVPGK